MKIFAFWSNLLRFHVRNNSYLKSLIRQLFLLLPTLSVLHFFVFQNDQYLEKLAKFQWKKWKFSKISHFFKAFLLGTTYPKDLFGKIFVVLRRLIFLGFLDTHADIHISTKLSKIQLKSDFFRCLVKFSLLWFLKKSYHNLLIWQLFVLFSWIYFLHIFST